jgi:hypothetical protein
VPEWAEIVEFIRKVDGVAEAYLGAASRDASNNRDVIAAACSRCKALIGDAIQLIGSGSTASLGVILRTVYEVWLVGIYASLGRDEARQRLVDQYNHEIRYMLQHLDAPVEEIPAGQEFKIWDYAKCVRDLHREMGHPEADFSVGAYNTLYRFESLFSIHAGLGSIGLAVADEDHRSIIKIDPPTEASLRHRLMLAATLYLSLARSVALREGLDYSDSQPLEDWVINLRPAQTE